MKKDSVVGYLLILTFFFILLEFSFFVQCNRVYLEDYTFVSNDLHIPFTILPPILFFLFSELLLHLLYTLFIYLLVENIAKLFLLTGNKKLFLAIGLWLWGIITVFTLNQYYFPHSKFTLMTSILLATPLITKIVLLILLSVGGLILLLTVFAMNKRILLFVCMTSFMFIGYSFISFPKKSAPVTKYPNIIIIGVDSLRPDFLSFFGAKQQTPFFDGFLQKATVFVDAFTPLARTFPSWTSILTGEYPKQTTVRTNLNKQDKLNLSFSLPRILQQHGYETIYATDETRFSNIDTNFGFDKIISPPVGLNDFLLGQFNDFPLSNLLTNSIIGKWLFPYSYANRPAYHTYSPNSFLRLVQAELNKSKKEKPLFLAIHFCLTHYPYLWAHSSNENLTVLQLYVKSIMRVDKQISDFFTLLKQDALLNHAIVILLSDHGEALQLNGDRVTEQALYVTSQDDQKAPKFYPSSKDSDEMNQSVGHGTDVLGLPQYHALLAFKFFGMTRNENQAIMMPGVVSLLDIKPTVLTLLNIPTVHVSGVSLAELIKGKSKKLPNRHIFLESDYSPQAVRTIYPELRDVLLEGIDIFEINPSNMRLTIKPKMVAKIIRSKQYADIYGEWILALYPQKDYSYMPILVNLNSGLWTNDMGSRFALKSPAKRMLAELKQFYGEELAAGLR